MSSNILDTRRLRDEGIDATQRPFPFVIVKDVLTEPLCPDLDDDFPDYKNAGFFPYEARDCGPKIRALVDEMTSPVFADTLGARLGIEHLSQFPTLVTICRSLNRRHGTIHTDSRSKVATALLYLNPEWPDTSDGCLRFLHRIDDIDALVVPEIKPLYGTLTAFKRADNSFHGHLPYEGERRVIQVAWLTSLEEKERKTRRGRFSRRIKKLFSGLDRRLGAGRGRNASHPD